jgi:hypothetical protein
MRTTCCALLIIFLAGCGATTAEQLRANAAGVHTFKVDAEYQEVYQKTLAHAQTCNQQAAFGNNARVQGYIFIEPNRSTISIANSNAFAVNMLFTIDIAQVEINSTEVKVYYALQRYKPTAHLVEDWILNDSNDCVRGKVALECVCYLQDHPY